jgi:LPS-assembly protein
MNRMPWRSLLIASAVALMPTAGFAQFAGLGGNRQEQPVSRQQPVTFTADSVQYDRNTGIVTATGHVEAWQNGHILRADKVTFDRNSNVAAASGHVVLQEPDGQVLFGNYVELTQGMRDAVMRGMSATLAENGKLVANGARRLSGEINEMSRAIYSTCNLCVKDPTAPPFWQLRAGSMVEDLQNKRIEYYDAFLDIYGVPVMYFPYFSSADPSVKRASGFLVPSFGTSKHLGEFFSLPYYWVLDDQSDLTIVPTLATAAGPNVDFDYRRRFNDGTMNIETSMGRDQGSAQGVIFASGSFNLNDTWRYGFNIQRASSEAYMRDFHFSGWADVLTSSVYAEGFGPGAYSKIDTRLYQGLVTSVISSNLPVVIPRYEYSYFGTPDQWGGRLSLDINSFNVLRQVGTNTQRAGGSLNWERPFTGQLGDLWKLTFHVDAAQYVASDLNKQPNFSTVSSDVTARAEPTGALEVRWPLVRQGWGTQTIEPIAQLVMGPNTGSSQANKWIPNEDSLDFQFTDANLFALNRFPGIDRLEGGLRANVGLHGDWTVNGTMLDALVGQSYREHVDETFPLGSGLQDHVSDIVGRVTFVPSSWLDFNSQWRLDHDDFKVRYSNQTASFGHPILRLTAGYLYTSFNPYNLFENPGPPPPSFFTPRNEVTLGVSSSFGRWNFSAYGRRDIEDNKMIAAGLHAQYEDECVILSANYDRRYVSIDGDNGATTLLFMITLKTVGQFGFNAL